MFRRIVPFLMAAVVFFILLFITNRPSTDLFELPVRTYTLLMENDGTANVTETFTMRFIKPFRYVTWSLDMPEGVTIENFHYEVLQGPPLLGGVQFKRFEPRNIDILFQFSRTMGEYIRVPRQGLIIELKFSYRVKNLLVQGRDFTQLFIKYAAEAPVITKKLDVKIVFPDEFGRPIVYQHPWGLAVNSRVEGGIRQFIFRNVPPNTFVEGRYVFEKILPVRFKRHEDVSLREVLAYEKRYIQKNYFGAIFAFVYGSFAFLFPIFLYRKFGREFSIIYDVEYEREIPYGDSPAVVNGVVKKLCASPDEHGLNGLLLNEVKEKRARFIVGQKGEVEAIEFLTDVSKNDVAKIFNGFISENKLDLNSFKKALQRESNARKFLQNFRKWQQDVLYKIREKKLMDEKGNRIAKSFAVVFCVLIPLIGLFALANLGPEYRSMIIYVRTVMFLCVSTGIAIILMRKDVFSRWTKEGLLYYLRWKNFEKFLLDFSALSMYPPQSVAIWDEYIVYATALGIARTVAENFRKLNPPAEAPVTSFVLAQPKALDVIPSVVRTASQTVAKSSSSSSFKGGSVGSGAGGSRIGAG